MKCNGRPEREAKATGRIASSAGSISAAVFLSRILGLVREQVLAGFFGAGTAMDAFVVAFRIPNLLRDLFAEGALSAAFVTVFSDYETKRSPEETWRLVNNLISTVVIILSTITLVGIYFSEELVMLLALDFAHVSGKVELTTHLTRIMFPFLLLVSLSSVAMGILNTRGIFFVPALASSFFNVGSLTVGVGLALVLPYFGRPAIEGMAVGTLAGGVFQLLIQLPLVFKQGFRIRPFLSIKDPGLKRIARLIMPAIIGLSATQVNIFINTSFASTCAEGSVAWLNYAFRLIQFPIGLFGVALSMATLPLIAKQAASGERNELADTLVSSLNMVFILTLPAAIGLWVMADKLVALIFEHGRFTSFDTEMTAAAIRFYAVGLMAYSAVKVAAPIFYAINETKWPVIGSFTAVASNIIIILFTIDFFHHRAIALSTSISMIMNFLLLAFVLYKKIGGYPVYRLLSGFFRAFAASLLMGAVVMNAERLLGSGKGLLTLLGQVGGLVILGVVVYFVLIYLFRIHEARTLIHMFLSKLGVNVKK